MEVDHRSPPVKSIVIYAYFILLSLTGAITVECVIEPFAMHARVIDYFYQAQAQHNAFAPSAPQKDHGMCQATTALSQLEFIELAVI